MKTDRVFLWIDRLKADRRLRSPGARVLVALTEFLVLLALLIQRELKFRYLQAKFGVLCIQNRVLRFQSRRLLLKGGKLIGHTVKDSQ